MPALAVGGWLAAAIAAAVAVINWRTIAALLEAVARTSHELRGPLTAVRLGLHAARRGGDLSRERLRGVELELGRATLALGDLDTVGEHRHAAARQLSLGPSCIERLDLAELLADSVEAWSAYAALRDAKVRLVGLPAPVYVEGDRLRLAQAVGNLVANAIEHGGGSVALTCRGEHETARVEVTDGGPGLPAPVLALIRGPRRGRGPRGRGLAIAAAVAVTHGG
ncbi:MAG: HAMP domain-containing histidine kinase, partial [Actinomycetota bacterium]|nr:HAMP domain-containing histidine kinase [Actinomycetota bacterium]